MARVQLLTSSACLRCDEAKRIIVEVLRDFPLIDWEEISLDERPDLVTEHRLISQPAVLIDGALAFKSVPTKQALRRTLSAFSQA